MDVVGVTAQGAGSDEGAADEGGRGPPLGGPVGGAESAGGVKRLSTSSAGVAAPEAEAL